jgi:hypothetical protein
MSHARFSLLLAIFVVMCMSSNASAKTLVGINTDHLVYYSPACPTIDAIKTAQRFGTVRNPGDGKAKLDENGWPTDDFGVLVAADVPGIAGVYKLSCEGKASVFGAWGRTAVKNLKFDGKLTTADVEYRGGQAFALTLTHTEGGVRNLKLLRAGYTSDEQVFTNEYLKSKEPFGGVRLMNWSSTNHTKVSTWDDRCKPTDAQWSDREKGGPWEPWLDWAAKNNKDLWLCIPHLADDGYVRNLATLCKERVGNADVNLYLEDTNEYWNWQFPQAKWMDEQSRLRADEWKLNDPPGGETRHRYHARRTVEIGRIFRDVFGPAGAARVRPVLTGQLAGARATEDAMNWLERQYAPAKDHIYAVACAPYFGTGGDVVNRIDLTPEQLADHLLNTAKRYSTPESKTAEGVRRYHEMARKAGVRSIAYEGGVDLGQAPPKIKGDVRKAYVNARVQSQFLPVTGAAITEYFNWWFTSGGQEFFYFQDFSIYNQSGYWGLSNDPTKLDTPKYQAAVDAAKKYAE